MHTRIAMQETKCHRAAKGGNGSASHDPWWKTEIPVSEATLITTEGFLFICIIFL